jgi:hypothetical protein
VVDLDPIPLAETDDENTSPNPPTTPIFGTVPSPDPVAPLASTPWIARGLIVTLCSLHGLAIWWGLGGLAGLNNGWPLWRDDHPLYYHSALVTRSFLKNSWTTAGYDPRFMAGYAKSVVFPSSSTLPELVVALFGGKSPEFAYKIYVLVAAAGVPWLVALACFLWRVPAAATAIAVFLDLLYIWTDFPIYYVEVGMLPYFVAIPVGLVATGAFARFLASGGIIKWLLATALLSLTFLCHLTSAMVIAPAAVLSYAGMVLRRRDDGRSIGVRHHPGRALVGSVGGLPRRLTAMSHLAVWTIPVIVLALNSFWWLPGIWLASTKGESGFAFFHTEGVARRLVQIAVSESPVECLFLAAGLPGLVLLVNRDRPLGWALCGFCAAGMFWGYFAGGWRSLDFLQPGRHTYAFFTALSVAGGAGINELRRRAQRGSNGVDHLDRWVLVGAAILGIRIWGAPLVGSLRVHLASEEPFLSSRPSPRLLWIMDRVKRYLQPGQRLLYEEGGKDLPGIPDPFQHGRFSGLLPERTGVEVLGGPYLHASLKTNFTQFGEGRLFGRADWDRAFFNRYAKLYRPSAILCWSPHARRFCQENSDLVQVLEDDGKVMFGRIVGFEGDFIEGSGRVEATPGRIRVANASAGLDGTVLLRYHFVPYLTTSPSVACEPEKREDDPVPFIRFRPLGGANTVDFELHLPVGR